MFPASTVIGVPVFVTAKSDWPAAATMVVTVAELFVGFGSMVVADTFAVSVMTVPDATAEPTFATTVNVVDEPTGREAMLQK